MMMAKYEINNVAQDYAGPPLSLWLAAGLAFATYFHNLPLAGTGISVVVFAFLASYVFVLMEFSKEGIFLNVKVLQLFLLHITFLCVMAFAFWQSGSTSLSDKRYLLSAASNALWLPLGAILIRKWKPR